MPKIEPLRCSIVVKPRLARHPERADSRESDQRDFQKLLIVRQSVFSDCLILPPPVVPVDMRGSPGMTFSPTLIQLEC
jgi:hypothetical protein